MTSGHAQVGQHEASAAGLDGPEIDLGARFSPAPTLPAPRGQGPAMHGAETTPDAPDASLVGSLALFPIPDVLMLLASTGQTGELHVVGESMDGRIWLDGGELSNAVVGSATTLGQAVFDLACFVDGWFHFIEGAVSSNGMAPAPVADVLREVQPQVDEWRALGESVPLEAAVALSPTPPGQDVQIRSDQWQLLTTIGNTGQTVRAVLEAIGGDQVSALRNLRDLLTAGLIVLERSAPAKGSSNVIPTPPGAGTLSVLTAMSTRPSDAPSETDHRFDPLVAVPTLSVHDSPGPDQSGGLAETTIMPPPIADDPWAPTADFHVGAPGDTGVA